MKHTKAVSFGPLGSLHVQHQVLAQCPRPGEQITFLPPMDKMIARAFEETRQGLPVDRVMADPELAQQFLKRCRQLGVRAPESAVALRLFRFRKSPERYPRLRKATVKEAHRDFSPYLFAAEMALAQVKYRFGASVDDILAYPAIGREFDQLAEKLQPGWTPLDYRLAALHIRKSRYCKPEERPLFERINQERADSTVKEYGSLDRLNVQEIPQNDGIIGLVEKTRYTSRFLYIEQAEHDVPQLILPFTRQETFDALANSFWSPSLAHIHLVIYGIHDTYRKASRSLWTKRLIFDKSPVFNSRIRLKKSAA